MDAKTQVVLTGPAKIDGAWMKAGDAPLVDADTLQQLLSAGVVPTLVGEELLPLITLLPGTELIFTQAEFDAAVEAKAKEMAGAAFDGALADLEADVKAFMADAEKLEAEKAVAIKRAEVAEAAHAKLQGDIAANLAKVDETIDRLQARNAELEATIAELTPPPEAAPAAKKAKGG